MNLIYEIVGTPFGYVMRFIYNIVKDYGAAIVIFTLFTKAILFPITYKQQVQSERMRALQPKIAKLKKEFAKNPQRMQQEQMKLYQEEHVSMTAGCFPMIIQMILLFGMLDVVYKPLSHILNTNDTIISNARKTAEEFVSFSGKNDLRIELKIMEAVQGHRDAFVASFSELLSKIDIFNNKLFGIADLTAQPTLKPDAWTSETLVLALIPFAAGIFQLISSVYSMWRQKKVNPDMPSMGFMKVMMYTLPLVSIIFAFQVPAGVGFYWAVSALFSFMIMVGINRYMTPARVEKILIKEKEKASKKKPGMFQRAMQQQQEMLANQQSNYSDDESTLSRKELNELNIKKLEEARKRIAEKYEDE